MKKKRHAMTLILTPIILCLLVGGLFYFFYSQVSSANKAGNMMGGTWTANGKEVLVMDIENKSYSLDFSGIKESGKIANVELVKDDSENDKLIYKVTFEADQTYDADITVDFSKDEKEHEVYMSFSSDKMGDDNQFVQADPEE